MRKSGDQFFVFFFEKGLKMDNQIVGSDLAIIIPNVDVS